MSQELNIQQPENFFVNFEEVTGHDFEFSKGEFEMRKLPVIWIWENFECKIAKMTYVFTKGDVFDPYNFTYDQFKSHYMAGLIGTTRPSNRRNSFLKWLFKLT